MTTTFTIPRRAFPSAPRQLRPNGTVTLLLGASDPELEVWSRYSRDGKFITDRAMPLDDLTGDDRRTGNGRNKIICPGLHRHQHTPYGTMLFLRLAAAE